ncbi:hypothetical protein ACQP1P_38865 [Dactylosporangium sp. CA-052675]|uniref:hypothetical protein n=1 Tax=Dactylosporangium sp. CA-052675 TaxID=3239927 RepID=UPI003D8A619E
MSAKKQLVSGEELRARRDARLAGWPDARQQAQHHEQMLLKGIGSAQDAFDWIIEHGAWTDLGFESVAEWWTTNVRPVMVRLEMRPTPAMVEKLLAKVREVESALPRAQRRTQRELESLTLASEWQVRGRTETRNRRSAAGSDLDARPAEPTDTAAVAAHGPADDEPQRDSNPGSSAAGSGDPAPEPAVTPTDITEDDARPNTDDVPPPPASDQGVDEAGGQAHDPEVLLTSGEADPVQDGTGATRPAPDPSDPAALLDWFAGVLEQVEPDVSGPLLTSEDMALIGASLDRVVFIVELLQKWFDRTQP